MSCPTPKICFNPECRNLNSEKWRKGWRLRSYDFANLCDRCGSIYDDGRFCETFHKYASGWRSCETCGKRVHCGCIVSINAFVVLDAGGIECAMCSRKNAILTSNTMWPPRPITGRLAEGPIGNWNQTVGPGSSESWAQAVNLYNWSIPHSEYTPSKSFEADVSTGLERLFGNDRFASFPSERYINQNLRFSNGGLRYNGSEMLKCGETVFSNEEEPDSFLTNAVHQSIAFCPALGSQANNQKRVSASHPEQHCHPEVMGKKLGGNSHDGVESSHETQICNGKPADVRVRKELLPQYWPKISNEALQHISGVPHSVITPLFEKTLSASDTGRIGRLVLPKKCAEIYFPAISQPEGLPLIVQDIKGKEWIFQFRFWPNNNSRMYVLEGITNCIQSLQLQAGDVVTFSRTEPEGKLIMGFRKASTAAQSDQLCTQATRHVNETRSVGDVGNHKPEINENLTNCHLKNQMSESHLSRDQSNTVGTASLLSKTARAGYVVNEAVGTSSSIPSKRKNGVLFSKRKCLKVDNADLLELMVTLEEAQGLFRAPADHAPNIVIIEDVVFEEYEDAPVIGRPTIVAKGSMGFSCDAARELASGQLKDLLSVDSPAARGKLQDAELGSHASEAMEALANSTIEAVSEASPDFAQLTSKHPRHRPGCSCVVCNQPSSGRGHKHHYNCTCEVCLMVKQKQKPRTIMLHHGINQSGDEAATQKFSLQDNKQSPEKPDPRIELLDSGCLGYVNAKERVICTSIKGQIDLNIQPEREEEASTFCELTKTIRIPPDTGKANPKGIDKYKLVFEVASGGNSVGPL